MLINQIPDGMIQRNVGICFGQLVSEVAREEGIDTSQDYYRRYTHHFNDKTYYFVIGYPIIKINIIKPKLLTYEPV